MSGTLQPVERQGAMGVERQRVADEAAAAPARDSSMKRGEFLI